MLQNLLDELQMKADINLLSTRTALKVYYASKYLSSKPLKQVIKVIFDLCPDYAKNATKYSKGLGVSVDELVLTTLSSVVSDIFFLYDPDFMNLSFSTILHYAIYTNFSFHSAIKAVINDQFLLCSKRLHKNQHYKRVLQKLLKFSFEHAKNLISVPVNLVILHYSTHHNTRVLNAFDVDIRQPVTVVSFSTAKAMQNLIEVLALTKVKLFVCRDFISVFSSNSEFGVHFCKKCGKPTETTLDFIELLKLYAV